ncbi:hypothetical protein [Methylocaldum sp.]|uniref:hypothetical protein n=1 Tax=Methylocaldum sp. TaxID=1969727 RepID=UPI002D36DF16|nr:hypothetical protein [Methylocaldum sp.]HYE38190.1 hypothetical protein [Methylocaldum sp.]
MTDPCLIYDDPRPVLGIYYDDEQGTSHSVGTCGCTAIVAYKEHGVGDYQPFFAVYYGDELRARVPAWKVSVGYGAGA